MHMKVHGHAGANLVCKQHEARSGSEMWLDHCKNKAQMLQSIVQSSLILDCRSDGLLAGGSRTEGLTTKTHGGYDILQLRQCQHSWL